MNLKELATIIVAGIVVIAGMATLIYLAIQGNEIAFTLLCSTFSGAICFFIGTKV